MSVWLVGQCSKTIKFGLKIPGVSRPCRYFDDNHIWVLGMLKLSLKLQASTMVSCIYYQCRGTAPVEKDSFSGAPDLFGDAHDFKQCFKIFSVAF